MRNNRRKLKVLFLCTGNACRSQMAEGWARALQRGAIEPYSAGIEAHGLDPLAARVMAEAGVDIGGQQSKTVEAVRHLPFDYVVTLCGHANESCPTWLSGKAKVLHVGFDDPRTLAKGAKTEADALVHYRRIRDELRALLATLPSRLEGRGT
jgi:arsenate reductase (thioredoxin)